MSRTGVGEDTTTIAMCTQTLPTIGLLYPCEGPQAILSFPTSVGERHYFSQHVSAQCTK